MAHSAYISLDIEWSTAGGGQWCCANIGAMGAWGKITPAWAFFALFAIAAAVYALNRGVYAGSRVGTFNYDGKIKYVEECRYLFPSGVHYIAANGLGIGDTPEQAEHSEWYCRFFQPSPYSN
jgi:hypothetical protein